MPILYCFFFFNDAATTEIYTLSLHDALPILAGLQQVRCEGVPQGVRARRLGDPGALCGWNRQAPHPRGPISVAVVVSDQDRKSTRLNSSHSQISYAVFCLKKKKT